MEQTIEKIIDVQHLTKEELIERYEWQINNLVNPKTYLFETSTDLAGRLGKHVVEWNRMLRDCGILVPVYRVGKKGMKDIDIIGWKIADDHRKYLLANGMAIEIAETRDAVYWNQTKITHIICYINIYLKKSGMPLIDTIR
ncbi:MAG: hypothetical protein J6D12_04255 [Peptostreptococcaceae bacterium]|nr:hypothetical protein [Peptostreptococcaceae bacterium]